MPGFLDQFGGTPPVGVTPGMQNTGQSPMAAVNQQAPDLVSDGMPMSPLQKLLTQLRNHMYGAAAGDVASGVGNGISNAMMPNTDGLQGLLSDQDNQHARSRALLAAGAALSNAGGPHVGTPAPTLMQAISGGLQAGQQASAQDIGSSLQNKMQGMSIAQQMHILAGRQAIGRMFAPQPGETPSQTAAKLPQAYAAYAAMGDTEMLERLAPVISQMPQFKGLDMMDIDTGGSKLILNKATGQVLGNIPKTMSDDTRVQHEFSNNVVTQAQLDREQAHRDQMSYQNIQQNQHEEDSWMRDSKPYADAARIMGSVESAIPNASNNPVAQRQILQGFVQLQNPNASNIRPNALTPYIQTMGLGSEISKAVAKLDNGQALSPVQMQQVIQAYRGLKAQKLSEYQTLRKARVGQAKALGLSPQLYDPFADSGAPPAGNRPNPLLQ